MRDTAEYPLVFSENANSENNQIASQKFGGFHIEEKTPLWRPFFAKRVFLVMYYGKQAQGSGVSFSIKNGENQKIGIAFLCPICYTEATKNTVKFCVSS